MRVKVLSANLNGHKRGDVIELDDATGRHVVRERLAEETTEALTGQRGTTTPVANIVDAAPASEARTIEHTPAKSAAKKATTRKRAAKKRSE